MVNGRSERDIEFGSKKYSIEISKKIAEELFG